MMAPFMFNLGTHFPTTVGCLLTHGCPVTDLSYCTIQLVVTETLTLVKAGVILARGTTVAVHLKEETISLT